MKLDNDLIRIMLLKAEKDADGRTNYEMNSYCENAFPDYALNKSIYHMKYLVDAGFIQAKNGYFLDITPNGRDFLNNIRNDAVWAETQKAVKPLGTVAINIVSDIAASVVKKMFNLP